MNTHYLSPFSPCDLGVKISIGRGGRQTGINNHVIP